MPWIEEQIKKVSMHRFLAAIAVLAIIIAALIANARYISSFFKGPQIINSAAQLIAAGSPENLSNTWVSLQADKINATRLQQITVRKKRGVERSRKVSATYFVATIGQHFLVVRAHEETPTPLLTGSIKVLDESVKRNLLRDFPAELQSSLLPFLLDTEDFQADGYIGFTIAGLIAVFATVVGSLAFVRWRNPSGHAVIQQLSKRADGPALFTAMQAQVNQGSVTKVGKYVLTPQFAIYQGFFEIKLQLLDELLWAYKNVVKTRIYYVIPTGKKFSASLNFQNATLAINGKESAVDSVLQHIERHAPWALLGFDEAIETTYKKNKAQLLQIVSQRKQRLADGASADLAQDEPPSIAAEQ